MKITEIEIEIKNSIENKLNDLSQQLQEIEITYTIDINNSGNGANYFSEIEVTFWQNDNILDVISVIMFAGGKLRDTTTNFTEWFDEEIKQLLNME